MPVQGARIMQPFQQYPVQPRPHSGRVPLAQPAPARLAAAAEFQRQLAPLDAGAQHEQDASQGCTVRGTGPSALQLRPLRRQQRLHHHPQIVRNKQRHAASTPYKRFCPRLLGVVPFPPVRVDGYCLLIDADLYRQFKLDEDYAWWWSITKLQAQVLRAGLSVRGYLHHERYLHHFGGKSGSDFKQAKGMDTSIEEADKWFGGAAIQVIETAI